MFLITFLVFICMVILTIVKKDKAFAVISLFFLGLTLMIYSGTLYQSIMANYITDNLIDKIVIIQKINSFFNIGMTELRTLSLVGETMILLSFVFWGLILMENKKWIAGFLLIPISYYFIISLPEVAFRFYLEIYSKIDSSEFSNIVYNLCLWAKRIGAIMCFVFPIFVCAKKYRKTILWIIKRQIIIIVICIGIIDLWLLFFIAKGIINNFFDLNVMIFYKQITEESLTISNFYLLAVIFIIVLFVVFLFKSNVLGGYASVTRFSMFVDDYKMERNLRMVFHTYKNMFLMIKKNSDLIGKVSNNVDAVKQQADVINGIAESALYTITAHMEMMKKINASFQKFDIEQEMHKVIDRIMVDKAVDITFESTVEERNINSDPFYFSEIVHNIFMNAVEAVEGSENARIAIKMKDEKNWVLMEIYDNGRGIEKKKIKDIFKPLNSEKCGANNWGIGLYYVRKIIKALSGYLFVESEPGEYTIFRIYLPKNIENERRFRIWS